jgi:hypothetical protein
LQWLQHPCTGKDFVKKNLKTIVIVVMGLGLIYTGTRNQDEYYRVYIIYMYILYSIPYKFRIFCCFIKFVMPA